MLPPMSTDNIKINLGHTANVKDLPEPARDAFLLARSIYAFANVFAPEFEKRKQTPEAAKAVETHVTEFKRVRGLVQKAGVDVPETEIEDWTPAVARKRAQNLWKVGLLVLQRRAAMGEWFPDQINLADSLYDDPVLSVRAGGAVLVQG